MSLKKNWILIFVIVLGAGISYFFFFNPHARWERAVEGSQSTRDPRAAMIALDQLLQSDAKNKAELMALALDSPSLRFREFAVWKMGAGAEWTQLFDRLERADERFQWQILASMLRVDVPIFDLSTHSDGHVHGSDQKADSTSEKKSDRGNSLDPAAIEQRREWVWRQVRALFDRGWEPRLATQVILWRTYSDRDPFQNAWVEIVKQVVSEPNDLALRQVISLLQRQSQYIEMVSAELWRALRQDFRLELREELVTLLALKRFRGVSFLELQSFLQSTEAPSLLRQTLSAWVKNVCKTSADDLSVKSFADCQKSSGP